MLDKVEALCESLAGNPQIKTPQEFIEAFVKGTAPKPIETFGDFLRSFIDSLKRGVNNKRPSKSYQVYANLLHKLEGEGDIINVPVNEISNTHFIQFSNFLLSLSWKEGKCNYANLMARFKQIQRMAYNLEMNDNILRFQYMKNAPYKGPQEKKEALTESQYDEFQNLDLKKIPYRGPKSMFYKELYRDFCIFLYETKMRPVDVIKSMLDQVYIAKNGKPYLKYVPEKKKNSRERNVITKTPLTKKALEIMGKYKGKSKKGYILPFSMNDHEWDLKDARSWNKWCDRKDYTMGQINTWLKKIAKEMKLDFNLTTYTFRRSALTHACARGDNALMIALEAGTSVNMLQKHYVSNDI